jgi:hypothetical protein
MGVRMTVAERDLKKRSKPTEEMLLNKRIEEKKSMIDINQSYKGITWDEDHVPTLTHQASESLSEAEHSQPLPDQGPLILDVLQDFIPTINTASGHKTNCSCIKCKPKQDFKSPSALGTTKVIEDIVPFNNQYYDK